MARGHSFTPLALALVIAAGAVATPATAQQPAPGAPGVPPSQHGWQYEVEVADRLYENGYLDAAEKDYTAILTAYGDTSPAIDLAWLGLAKVHQARGQTSQARASLGEVLRRDSIPGVEVEARDRYRSLRAQAEMQLNEARRAVFYYEGRYRQTSWMNPFGKLFHYLDFRKSRKKYEEMASDLEHFDPRFLIEPVAKPSASAYASADAGTDPIGDALAKATNADGTVSEQYRLTPAEMEALLNQSGGTTHFEGDGHDHSHDHASSSTGDGTAATGAAGAGTDAAGGATGSTGDGTTATGGATGGSGDGTGTVVATANGAGEELDLDTAQASYFSTYQQLREALSSGDADRIQAATQAYQQAKASYEQAKTSSLN